VGNKPLTITFAEPRRADIAADQQNEIKSVFVGNLPDTATESKLREVFGPLGEITRAFIPAPRDGKTRREFGFVHYVDRASVLQAIKQSDEGDKFVMDGAPLDVSLRSVCCIAQGLPPEWLHIPCPLWTSQPDIPQANSSSGCLCLIASTCALYRSKWVVCTTKTRHRGSSKAATVVARACRALAVAAWAWVAGVLCVQHMWSPACRLPPVQPAPMMLCTCTS
jgi:RNA recognition motif. (a.k.a. RRM, RBD, or RNP domain)